MVQSILSSMNSDEVNSYSDTAESRQVAEVVKTTYFNIIARTNLPEHDQLFKLTASGDDTMPVLMFRPDNVRRLDWIKYNKSNELTSSTEPEYEYVTVLPLKQYLDIVHQFDIDDTNVLSFTLNNNIFYYKNDVQPTYCTVINDYYVIFDSYNDTVDDTLQTSKTLCFGQVAPSFTMDDDFYPDLDERQFPLLLNEAKALAFAEIKQTEHPKAERESRRQWVSLQRNKSLTNFSELSKLPDFGRK